MVNVRKKKNIQTKSCRPSGLLSDLQLNKSEGSSSVANLKTLSNSSKEIPTGKLFGIRKFDLIKTSKGIGFVKGKRSNGHFAISSIDGTSISDSVNVKKSVKRLSARKTVLLIRKNLEAHFLLPLKGQVSLREKR